jgi:hypothetical protein
MRAEAAGRHDPMEKDWLYRLVSVLVFVPVVVYFAVLWLYGVNIPVEDDLELLQFVLGFDRLSGLAETSQAFVAQHNEHRVATIRLGFLLMAKLQSQIDFKTMMYLCSSALLGVLLFFAHLLPVRRNRPLAILAIAFLLFTLQHWHSTIWAMSSLQHYPSLLAACGVFHFLERDGWRPVALAAALSLLVLGSIGSGIFLFVAGAMQLLAAGRRGTAVGWSALGVCIAAAYFWGYQRPAHHPSILAALADPVGVFDYLCSLLGGVVSVHDPSVGFLARFAGLAGLLYFVHLTLDGYYRRSPVVYFFMAYLIMTAISLAVGRSGMGLSQAFDSRYRLYSSAWSILIFIALLDRGAGQSALRQTRTAVLGAALASLIWLVSLPSSLDSIRLHTRFYGDNLRQWSRGETLVPGPAHYSRVVTLAIERGVYRFPCDQLSDPDAPLPHCDSGGD